MQVSDEIMIAATKAYHSVAFGLHPHALRAALEAALSTDAEPMKTAPTVAVKDLEWVSDGIDHQAIPIHHVCYYVSTSNSGVFNLAISFGSCVVFREEYTSLALAKEAAKDDYEARILSALSTQVQDASGAKPQP